MRLFLAGLKTFEGLSQDGIAAVDDQWATRRRIEERKLDVEKDDGHQGRWPLPSDAHESLALFEEDIRRGAIAPELNMNGFGIVLGFLLSVGQPLVYREFPLPL